MLKISYDCWGTLIKGNPNFKKQQSELAESIFGIEPKKFLQEKSKLKLYTDYNVELYGVHFDRDKLYKSFLECSQVDLDKFIYQSNELFLSNPPIRINDMIKGHYNIISSNTVFIYGDTLSKIFKEDDVKQFNFSDRLGVSKPNKEMFKLSLNEFPDFHVGDNPRTDGRCTNYGVSFIDVEFYENFKKMVNLM